METALIINSILLWVVIIFNLLITFRLIQIVAPDVWAEHLPKLREGQFALFFEISSTDGQAITLTSFQDQAILLVFISVKCPSCWGKIPDFQALDILAKKVGVQLVLICDSEQHRVKALIEQFDIVTPLFIAPKENVIWKNYKVSGVPFYCLINDRSRVQAVGLLDSQLERLTKLWKINAL